MSKAARFGSLRGAATPHAERAGSGAWWAGAGLVAPFAYIRVGASGSPVAAMKPAAKIISAAGGCAERRHAVFPGQRASTTPNRSTTFMRLPPTFST